MSTLLLNQVQSLTGKTILQTTGSILQVKSTIVTSQFTTSATMTSAGGGAAITDLSVSITPTASTNKMWVMAQLNCAGQAGATQVYAYLARGTTPIGVGPAAGNRSPIGGRYYLNDANTSGMIWMQFLDSPNTTNGITYNVYVGTQNTGTVYINRTQNDEDQIYGARGSCVLTVMEVVA